MAANPTLITDEHPTHPFLMVAKQTAWSPDEFRWVPRPANVAAGVPQEVLADVDALKSAKIASDEAISDLQNANTSNETVLDALSQEVNRPPEFTIFRAYDEVAPDVGSVPEALRAIPYLPYSFSAIVRYEFLDHTVDYISGDIGWEESTRERRWKPGDTAREYDGVVQDPIQKVTIQHNGLDAVEYYVRARPDNTDFSISPLDTVQGYNHWILAGQSTGYYKHAAIMHLAEEGSIWRVYKVPGVFMLNTGTATLEQKQASAVDNPVFTRSI